MALSQRQQESQKGRRLDSLGRADIAYPVVELEGYEAAIFGVVRLRLSDSLQSGQRGLDRLALVSRRAGQVNLLASMGHV